MLKTFGFIYLTINLINGKMYIGKKKHSKTDKYYLGSGVFLKKAVKKYGRKNFCRIILDYAYTESELWDLEKYYIELMNADKDSMFYNVNPGGPGGCVGHVPSEYQLQRIKETHSIGVYCITFDKFFDSISDAADYIGIKSSSGITNAIKDKRLIKGLEFCYTKDIESYVPLTIEQIQNRNKQIEEQRKNIFIQNTHTEVSYKKSAESRKGKPNLSKMKKVININTMEIFDSCQAADDSIGMKHGSVSQGIIKQNKVHGCWFYYLDDYNKEKPTIEELNKKQRDRIFNANKNVAKANQKSVIDIDTLEEFESALSCDRAHGWPDKTTCRAINGNYKARGHKFKYKN